MAKKSAKSKGYRKSTEKKPYLSKRDILILCAVGVTMLAAVIALVNIDDNALKVKDGKIVDLGENWLVINGSTRGRRYYKLAELGELAGYTLEPTAIDGDENLHSFKYTPTEDSPVTSITVTGTPAKTERTAAYYQSLFSSLTPTELSTGEIGGVESRYFTYQSSFYVEDASADGAEAPAEVEATQAPAEAESEDSAEEQAPNHFEQALHAYFPATRDFTIGIGVQVSVDSEEAYLTQEQLFDLAGQAYAAMTLVE